MQLLIKAFSVEASLTRKTATEMAVEPEDSPAFDAVHSLLSLADPAETPIAIQSDVGERLAQIEAELADPGDLEAATVEDLLAGSETITPALLTDEGRPEDSPLVTRRTDGTVRADPKDMQHIEAAPQQTDFELREESHVPGMRESSDASTAEPAEVRFRQVTDASAVAPPADRRVTGIGASRLRDRSEIEAVHAIKGGERPDAVSGSPISAKDIKGEQPDLKPSLNADTDKRTNLTPARSETPKSQTIEDKTMALPVNSSFEELGVAGSAPKEVPSRARHATHAPQLVAVKAGSHGDKAVVSAFEGSAVSVTLPERAITRSEGSFKGDDRVSTDARLPGRSGFAAPPVQERVAPLVPFTPGAGAPTKGGIERLDFGEGSIERADAVGHGTALDLEEAVKTRYVDRVRPEPVAARSIINQVIQSVTRSSAEGFVEIRLQPEELGRIRLTMVAGETGMTVQISAERVETLELVRRNIDLLENDLLDHGFEDLSFSFTGEDRDASADDRGSPEVMESPIETTGSKGLHVALEVARQPIMNGKLDIRV